MKSFLLSCFLAFSVSAAAQQTTIVTGQITEPTHDSVKVSYYTNLVNFERVTTATMLKPDGSFSVTVPLNLPVAAFLEHNYDIIELYLQPGDRLNVTFDTQEIDETLVFDGQGAAENTCLAEISRKYLDDDDFNYSRRSVYADDQAYLKLVDKKFGWQEKFAEKYMKKGDVSENFKNWLRTEIKFGAALQKIQFPELRGTIVKIADPYKLSPNFYSFIAASNAVQNPDINSLCYINYKQELLKYEHRKITTNAQQPDYYASQYSLAKKLFDGEVEAIIAGRTVIEAYKKGQVKYADQIFEDYKNQPESKPYLALVNSAARYLKPLARGSKAPNLPMIDAKGNKISLDNLKGKAVYLYFYTLGCGSCQMEVAAARALAERLDDKELAFVFVSVDQDRSTWKKVVTKRPWPGITGQTLDSAATVKNYRISQYPAALILDSEGRIFEQQAKRFGSLELQASLEAVLKEERAPMHGHLLKKE